jgi:hypothetical protein
MALTERTRLYEVLMRVQDDRIAGIQATRITEVMRDGEVIAATLGDAQPLDPAGLAALLHAEDRAALAAACG